MSWPMANYSFLLALWSIHGISHLLGCQNLIGQNRIHICEYYYTSVLSRILKGGTISAGVSFKKCSYLSSVYLSSGCTLALLAIEVRQVNKGCGLTRSDQKLQEKLKMSQDGEKTYNSFVDSYEVPYTVVTILYIIALLMISAAVAITRLYYRCPKCCKSCKSSTCLCVNGGSVTKFSGWLVRLVFGKSEGVSEDKKGVSENEDLSFHGKDLYINDKPMEKLDINILGTIILCFGLLVLITAYSTYLLEVSHTCSEDTAIYCFPRLFGNESLIITEDELKYPITNCSQWVNSTIGPQVTFQCFRYAYNLQAAIATAGGLLAFFVVAMRFTMSIILKAFTKCNCCKCLGYLQILAVIILLLADFGLSLAIMSFQLYDSLGEIESEQDPVAQQTASYIADNGIQFLIVLGTTTLLLLVNWTKYAEKEKSQEPQKSQESKEREIDTKL